MFILIWFLCRFILNFLKLRLLAVVTLEEALIFCLYPQETFKLRETRIHHIIVTVTQTTRYVLSTKYQSFRILLKDIHLYVKYTLKKVN